MSQRLGEIADVLDTTVFDLAHTDLHALADRIEADPEYQIQVEAKRLKKLEDERKWFG